MFETEVRFYFNKNESTKIISYLKDIDSLSFDGRFYEVTQQFDHPEISKSFYSLQVDGRFRIRLSKCESFSKLKVSWKQRLKKDKIDNKIHKEREVEINLNPNEYNNLMYILNEVIGMRLVESYERYRSVFSNKEVEIVVDESPFATAIEIESKTDDSISLNWWIDRLGLKLEDAYSLSWDDKYNELCKEQGKTATKFVTFESDMPELKNCIFGE